MFISNIIFNYPNLCHLIFHDLSNENFKFIVGSRGEGDSYHFLIQKRTRNSLFAAARLSDDIEDYLEKSGGPKSPGLLKRIWSYLNHVVNQFLSQYNLCTEGIISLKFRILHVMVK